MTLATDQVVLTLAGVAYRGFQDREADRERRPALESQPAPSGRAEAAVPAREVAVRLGLAGLRPKLLPADSRDGALDLLTFLGSQADGSKEGRG